MRIHAADSAEEAVTSLLSRMAPALAASCIHAQTLDEDGIFPTDDVAALVQTGAIAAAVPTLMGGLGIGMEPARAGATACLLHAVGSASVALGRIVEGHINAIRLVMRNGNDGQRAATAADACAGHLHALWVTDGPEPLRYVKRDQYVILHGEKRFCSAAGHATRAAVTAIDPEGSRRLLLLPLQKGEEVRKLPAALQGVRSAGTGCVAFNGVRHDIASVFGAADAYLREPEFSALCANDRETNHRVKFRLWG